MIVFQGFDEYMNLVLEEAEELNVKKKTRKPLGWSSYFVLPVIACFSFMFHFIYPLGLLFLFTGRILLKGDNITLMMST